jgi:predicted Na+-dependent transporter
VASVGLVALAGADATIALGAVTGSLIVAAVVGPLAIGALAGGAGHVDAAQLLGRFAVVVLVPLAVGVAVRSAPFPRHRLERFDGEREGVAAITVAVLVYAALSGAQGAQGAQGAHGAHGLGSALVASLIFLAVSAALGELWRRRAGDGPTAVPGALAIAMRDFAVAAALASQAFGTRAGVVPGVYGVVMLLAGTVSSGVFARAARSDR